MEFYDNNRKCIIPFDSKDLSLLPYLNVSPKLNNNIMPLWSMNNLHLRNEDCYYEFEVIQSDNITDCNKNSSCTDSSYIESNVESSDFTKEMCHICNIKVPTVCMSEHLSSTKHKTFSRIAEISLERVKRQMGVTYKLHRLPTGYLYCDSCVDLVPEGDLKQHRKSKVHRNAQLIDRLLSELLNVYSDKSEANSEDESASTYVGSRDLNRNYSDKIYNASVNRNFSDKFDTASSSKLNPTKQGDEFDNSKIGYGQINATTTTDNRFTAIGGHTIDDGKVIAAREETEAVAVVDIKKSALDTAAKESKKKAIKLLPVKKNFNKRVVNSLGDLEEYIRGINTNGRFKLNVVNRDLVVETDGGGRARVEWSNFHGLIGFGKRHVMCILCKKIDRDMQNHILSQCHLDKLAMPIDKNFIRELDNDKGHCILCNDTIENPDVHVLCNKEHEAKLKLSFITEELDASEILDSTGQSAKAAVIEHKEPTTNDPVRYKSDNANGGRKIYLTKESIATEEGEKPGIFLENERANKEELKVGASMGNEPIVSVVGGNIDEVVCNICFVSVNPDDIQSHEQTPEHKYNEDLAIHHLLEYSPTYLTLKCKVCLTGFPVHLKAEHISSPFHQNSYKKLLAANTMVRSAHSVFCSTCVAYIMIGDELAHITSKTHITLIGNVLACSESEIAAAHTKANEQHYCTACSRYVPGDVKNLKTHEKGARHKKNLAALKAAEGKVGSTGKTQAPKAIPTPKAVVPTPKLDVPTPKAVVPTLKSDVPTPKAVVLTQKSDVPIPKAVVPTSKSDVATPKAVISNPKSDVPIRKAAAPTSKSDVPIPKAVESNSKSDLSIPKAVVPTSKLDVPIPKAVEANPKSDVPTPEVVAPTTKAVVAIPKTVANVSTVSSPVSSPEASSALYEAYDIKELLLTLILKEHLPLIRLTPKLTEVECKVCSTSLPNTPDIIQHHLDTYAHTNNTTKLVKGGLWFYHDVYWCSACDVCVPFGVQFQHISDSQHEENVTKLKEDENNGTRDFSKCPDRFDLNVLKSIGDKSSIRCQVCEVVVPVTGSTLRMHFAGRKHRSEAQWAPLLSMHTLRDAGTDFECAACRCYIPKGSLFQHVTKPGHIFNIRFIRLRAADPKISTGTDIDVESKSSQKHREVEGESNSGQKKGVEESSRGQLETESGQKGQLVEVEATTNNDQVQEVKAMTNDQPTPEAVTPTTKAVVPTPQAVVNVSKASSPVFSYEAYDNKELLFTLILKEHLPLLRLTPKLAEVECKICLTSLPNTPDIIQHHLDTYAHTNNTTKLDKGGLWFYHDVYWCSACDVCVPFGVQFQHISDSQHEENVTKLKEEENNGTRDYSKSPDRLDLNVLKSIGDKSSIRCQVCEVVVPVTGSSLRTHFAGRKHRSEAQWAPLLSMHTLRDAGTDFECAACRCYIPKGSLFQHVTKPRHIFHLRLARAADPKISTGTDSDVESKSSQKHREVEGESNSGQKKGVEESRRGQLDTESSRKSQLVEVEATTNNDQAQEVKAMTNDQPTPEVVAPTTKAVVAIPKAVANVSMASSPVSSPEALSALYEAYDIKELLRTRILKEHLPLIRLTPELAKVECKICSTSLSNTRDIIQQHLDTYAHTNNSTKLVKGGLWFYHDVYWCSACDVCVPFGWQFQHISDSQHEENVTKLKEDKNNGTRDLSKCPDRYDLNVLKSIGDKSSIRCQVCEVVVPVSGLTLRMHFAGRKHRSEEQLAPLLAMHTLRGADTDFECAACRCYIPNESLFEHITKPRHIFNIRLVRAADLKISTGTDIDVESKSSQKHREVEGESNSGQKKGVEESRRGELDTESSQKSQLVEVKAMTNDPQKNSELQFCGICDVHLTRSEANVSVHNDGARHMSNLKLMDQNRVRVVDEGCYCEACDTTFARDHLHQHIATMQHLVMLG